MSENEINQRRGRNDKKRPSSSFSTAAAAAAADKKESMMLSSMKRRTQVKMKHHRRYFNSCIVIFIVASILIFFLLFFYSMTKSHDGTHADSTSISDRRFVTKQPPTRSFPWPTRTRRRNAATDSATVSYNDNATIKHSQMQNHQPLLKFVTVVLPSVVNPKGRTKRLDAITSTWGPMSHAIYVTHPKSDSDYSLPSRPNLNSMGNTNTSSTSTSTTSGSTTFPQIMPIDASIATEEEGIPRLKHVISQIVQQYNPDFAFFVNDHTFVIPQHLCYFLTTTTRHGSVLRPDQHVYAGHPLRPKNQKGLKYAFNSGASGYILSRKTMQFLMEHLNDDEIHNRRKWLQGNPGLVIAQCLKEKLGLDPIDTRDDMKRHVFHAFGLIRVVKKEMDDWYEKKHEDLYEILGEDAMYGHKLQKGTLCCSPKTVSFHYVEWAETLALWEILMHVSQQKNQGDEHGMTRDELQQLMLEKWPTEKKDIGGYSHNLPPLVKRDVWDDLLNVVMSIAPSNQENRELCMFNY